MKSITTALALLLHLATLTLAAPHAELIEERQFVEVLTFYGAGSNAAFFSQGIPADDQDHPISKASTLALFHFTPDDVSSFNLPCLFPRLVPFSLGVQPIRLRNVVGNPK